MSDDTTQPLVPAWLLRPLAGALLAAGGGAAGATVGTSGKVDVLTVELGHLRNDLADYANRAETGQRDLERRIDEIELELAERRGRSKD